MTILLTDDHSSYTIKGLNYQGIVANGSQVELIDHVCSVAEAEMERDCVLSIPVIIS